MKRVAAPALVSLALGGCYTTVAAPPRPEPPPDRYVGTTRWVDPRHPVQLCESPVDYTKPIPRCSNAQPGARLVFEQIVYNRPEARFADGYAVRDEAGKLLYINTTDPILMMTEESKKADDAERAECKRKGGVSIGMTAAQVLASCWGKPRRVNKTITARGNREQWVYYGNYVYLEDGVVTTVQTSR